MGLDRDGNGVIFNQIIRTSDLFVSPMVNKTGSGFDIMIIEKNALFGNWWEIAGCSSVYLFL